MKTSVGAAILAAAACGSAILGAAILGTAILGADDAGAADLGYAARGSGFAGYGPPPAPPPFAFAVDPRCSIVPMPQLDLTGDTARFRATAVCQSRGLYTDSLMFPGPPVLYRGYSYGRQP
jgi:hypothetical protein